MKNVCSECNGRGYFQFAFSSPKCNLCENGFINDELSIDDVEIGDELTVKKEFYITASGYPDDYVCEIYKIPIPKDAKCVIKEDKLNNGIILVSFILETIEDFYNKYNKCEFYLHISYFFK